MVREIVEIIKPLKNKIHYIALILILLLIEAYCDLSLPSYTADIVNIGIQHTNLGVIYDIGFKMMLMVTISVISTLLLSLTSSRFASTYAMQLRELIFKKVLKFSNHELNKFSRASLITRSTNDVNQIQNILGMIFRTLLFAPIIGIGSIIKAWQMGTNLSWIIIVTFIGIAILFSIIIVKVVPMFKKMQKTIDKINQTAREIITGIPVIKAFVRKDHEQKRFDKTNKEFRGINLYVFRRFLILMPAMTLILNLMTVAILYFGAYQSISGGLLTGDIIAFIQYATQIVSSFIMIGAFVMMLPRVLVSARRVEEVLKITLTIKSGNITQLSDNLELEFKNVTFSYPKSEKETLKNLNFKLSPNKTTAIIGATGSGKSTILNLIIRLQDVSKGEILINEENIKNINLKTLRKKISFIPQKAMLFSGDIKSNIQVGKTNATDSEIKKALSLSEVDFIDDLSKEVLQGGDNFSGGQKQRLAIARALVDNHDFYLFDDCFSALDMKTEAKIKSSLNKIKENSSILIVSQRISTIKDADEIIVLDKGEIIDKGTHFELIDKCRIYREIVESQEGLDEVIS